MRELEVLLDTWLSLLTLIVSDEGRPHWSSSSFVIPLLFVLQGRLFVPPQQMNLDKVTCLEAKANKPASNAYFVAMLCLTLFHKNSVWGVWTSASM